MKLLISIFEALSSFFTKSSQSFFSFLRLIIYTDFNKKLSISQRASAVILANGPSLSKSIELHLALIKSKEIYCVNNMVQSEVFKSLKPENYLLLDPIFFDGQGALKGIADKTIQLIQDVDWPMNLFVPSVERKSNSVEMFLQNPNLNIQYFNYSIFEGFSSINHFFYAKNWAMPRCQNVLGATIFTAILRKHEEVFLFGADHSWHEELKLNENNELIGRQLHFYDNSSKLDFIKIKEHDVNSVHQIFASLSKAFLSYDRLQAFAKKQRVNILNASERSFIDAFEKVKL